jgi:hypothetical protein
MDSLKYLQLQEELEAYKPILTQTSAAILDQEVSKYPIFVVHQQDVEIGVVIVDKDRSGGLWSIHASTLEEFVSKQIVENDKVDDFIEVFKSPKNYFCLFVLSELGANFVFLPRKKKGIDLPMSNN